MAREKAPLPNAAPADDKKRAIDTAMAQIERMYGKGAIMRFGDKAELNVDYIPTGSLSLDVALGIGGLPKGRIVEIYGPESSGKTTLALHVLAQAQKLGGHGGVHLADAAGTGQNVRGNLKYGNAGDGLQRRQLPGARQGMELRRHGELQGDFHG